MMGKLSTAVLSAAAFGTFAAAKPVSNCVTSDVCYQVGVPITAVASGQGNIYYQIRASTRYSWVALGQGSQMAGANMFVVYADGSGNVTVSPRAGGGHFPPTPDSTVQITLLAGSGISADGQNMIANFACSNCQRWAGGQMSLTSTAADYIGAYLTGAPINSKSTTADIARHDGHADWQFDLTRASIDSDNNPYIGGGGGGNPQGGGQGNGNGGGGAPKPDDDGPGNGVIKGNSPDPKQTERLILAHGVIMTLVMIALYPLGAIIMPILGSWIVHGAVQLLAFLLMWAGFALGYVSSDRLRINFTETHTVFGTVVIALFGIQPILGVLHHMHFTKNLQRGAVSYIHIWYGRILMILGVVNGGLGIKLARKGNDWIVPYSVVAGLMFLIYAAVTVLGLSKKRRLAQGTPRGMEHQAQQGGLAAASKEQAAHGSPSGSVSR